MRQALIVGIDFYTDQVMLDGCVKDAQAVEQVLRYHGNGTVNFEDCTVLTASRQSDMVGRTRLREEVEKLFLSDHGTELALFYFAGHGASSATGVHLLASDSRGANDGLALDDVLKLANQSKATNRVVLLDSCHSGAAGSPASLGSLATLSEGLTILSAAAADQSATERNGRGIFTTLLVDALTGTAANLSGQISPGAVYAAIDQSLGIKDGQRPIFKTNVARFVTLRTVAPPIPPAELRRISEFFKDDDTPFDLDPTFEPETRGRDGAPDPIPENVEKYRILQKLNRLHLVVPHEADHMWHAAMGSKSCKLTTLGRHYRRLAMLGRI